jgi:hypothetical protein
MISVAIPEERRLVERSKHEFEDNIKIGIIKIGCEDVDWNYLDQ